MMFPEPAAQCATIQRRYRNGRFRRLGGRVARAASSGVRLDRRKADHVADLNPFVRSLSRRTTTRGYIKTPAVPGIWQPVVYAG